MNFEAHFPTIIGISDNNLLDSIPILKSKCLKIKEKINDEPFPFAESKLQTSFWHDTYGHLDNLSEFLHLRETILQYSLSFLDILGYEKLQPSNIKFTNMWVNFIGPTDYHALHIHSTIGQSTISGIYYVEAPLSSKLKFGSPYRDSYEPIKPFTENVSNFKMVSYDCIPGRIIMFKSNVYHGYDAHGSNELKISIPFNLQICL